MRLWQDSDGRDTMPLWRDARDAGDVPNPYVVGCRVRGAIDRELGTVKSVSVVVAPLITVQWDNGDGEIIYSMYTNLIEHAWPWE